MMAAGTPPEVRHAGTKWAEARLFFPSRPPTPDP